MLGVVRLMFVVGLVVSASSGEDVFAGLRFFFFFFFFLSSNFDFFFELFVGLGSLYASTGGENWFDNSNWVRFFFFFFFFPPFLIFCAFFDF